MRNHYTWEDYGWDTVRAAMKQDETARELDVQWQQLAPKYLALKASLPEPQQEILTDFECLHSDLAYRKAMLAWELGQKIPHSTENNSCNRRKYML